MLLKLLSALVGRGGLLALMFLLDVWRPSSLIAKNQKNVQRGGISRTVLSIDEILPGEDTEQSLILRNYCGWPAEVGPKRLAATSV